MMVNRDDRAPTTALMVTDMQSRVIRVNAAFCALTGYASDKIKGCSSSALYVLPEQVCDFASIEAEALKNEGIWTGDVNIRKENGEIMKGVQTTVSTNDKDEGFSHYIHIIETLDTYHQGGYDQNTQLPNRNMFKEMLSQEQANAKRKKFQLGVLFVDIDNFKVINDSLGFARGDLLLGEIANRLKSQLRGNDLIACLGGNQFAVLLPDLVHPEDANIVTMKLMHALEEGIDVAGNDVVVTISTGIVIFPGDGEDSETLLKHAERSMYKAKEEGGNNYQFYKASIQHSASNRLSLESEMRKAIEREEFVLHYQPQINTNNGRVVGMEALIRWQHPVRGMVAPYHFISVAEETGMIVPIGDWVLLEACRQNRAWHDGGLKNLKVAVNLSARQFSDRHLLEKVENALQVSGLDVELLELEITESVIMKDIEGTIALLEKLAAMGLTLAIDDFGTGYSSLSYLKRFPINKLKIDKSFIDDVMTNEDDATIAEAIIGLSHNLKLDVICEGVEDEDQFNWLQARSCNEIQGYYFSKPLPADAFEAFVRERNALF
ncbi:EAL domain-containing protein [Mariprofundus sp. EBB-1]|uniref:sensor domain-containing protein n=1 Tax=Mariprofundus sp. EBB-1 TaxID=2650971 RepID=UPI001F358272|nr:EAL domain-containing protein [Mariprofundus sp. EBB-1]